MNKVITVLLILGIVTFGYLYFKNNLKPPTNKETAKVIPSVVNPSITVERKEESKSEIQYETYTNATVGIKIKYPNQTLHTARCNGNTVVTELTPLKIFEDLDNSSIYLSFATDSILLPKETSSGAFQGSNGCQEKIVDLDYIKNGIDIGYPEKKFPPNYNFKYKQINSELDLKDLVKSYGKFCEKYTETLTDKEKGIYGIKIESAPYSENACFINYGYKFLYSKIKKMTVTWATGQYPYWQIDGKVYDVDVNFID